ncbi:MAG: hypothetical protein HY455_00940 [Parcubacteria group bacterium]|nr:hypothetical protein [Parcubacteria group bacterium]
MAKVTKKDCVMNLSALGALVHGEPGESKQVFEQRKEAFRRKFSRQPARVLRRKVRAITIQTLSDDPEEQRKLRRLSTPRLRAKALRFAQSALKQSQERANGQV